jgi:lysophospholipase L1-like esterase
MNFGMQSHNEKVELEKDSRLCFVNGSEKTLTYTGTWQYRYSDCAERVARNYSRDFYVDDEKNSYEFWSSRVSSALGEKYAYWNLGIGFGRANDLASDGAWLHKVKQNDIAIVCYGVNDIGQGMSDEQIKSDLSTIVEKLNEAGCEVILQTIPPFDYNEEITMRWLGLNEYIKTELSKKVLFVFDDVPYLSLSESEPQRAKYGGHPNEQGSAVWASALIKEMRGRGF